MPELKDFSKDTVLPKAPLSAYVCFACSQIIRDKIKAQNPNIKHTEIVGKLGELWNGMSDKEKKLYETESAKDHQRHSREVEQLRTIGYFVNKDGIKSTELKKKRKMADIRKDMKLREIEHAKQKKIREKERQVKLREKENVTKQKMKVQAARDKIEKANGWKIYLEQKIETEMFKVEGRNDTERKKNAKILLLEKWNKLSAGT